MLTAHEAATIFPMLDDDKLQSLADDIKKNGLLEPVALYDGQVLDGRNRIKACKIAGIEVTYTTIDLGDKTPTDYVVSKNLHRRHLSESERGYAAGLVKEIEHKAAKERQIRKPGNSVPANLPEQTKGDARDKAAALLNVSARTVDAASYVIRNGVTELVHALRDGEIKVSAARRIAQLSPAEQREHVKNGAVAMRKAASAISNAAKAKRAEECDDTPQRKVYRQNVEKVYESAKKLATDLGKKPMITVNIASCLSQAEKLVAYLAKILGVEKE